MSYLQEKKNAPAVQMMLKKAPTKKKVKQQKDNTQVQKKAPIIDTSKHFPGPPAQAFLYDEKKKEEKAVPVQSKTADGESTIKKPASEGAKSKLPDGVKGKMEACFGTDFSDVNVHANSDKATEIGALAYAQGSDVHFAPGQFNPDSQKGQELIGHELAHVVQQKEGRVSAKKQGAGMPVNNDPGLEKEADEMGVKAAQGKMADVQKKGSGVQKKNAGGEVVQCKGNGYTNLNDEPDSRLYKEFGRNIVGTYRFIEDLTAYIRDRKKNTDGGKLIFVGVAQAAIKAATIAIQVPAPVDIELVGGLDVETNFTSEAIYGTAAEKLGGKVGPIVVEKALQPGEAGVSEKHLSSTTTKGVMKHALVETFGSLQAAAKTVLRMIPFVTSLEKMGKGAYQIAESRDDYNKTKGELLYNVEMVLLNLQDIIALMDEMENFENIPVTTANKKVPVRHKTRMLKEVTEKYAEKVAEFRKVARSFSEKHEDVIPLLAQDQFLQNEE